KDGERLRTPTPAKSIPDSTLTRRFPRAYATGVPRLPHSPRPKRSSPMRALGVGLVLTLVLAGNEVLAAQQLVATKTILVKNPPSGARKVLWKVKETAATVMGNPITQGGATLHVQLNPGPDQCVSMPAS